MTDPHLLVGAYATDALTDDERTAFESHLADCPDCRQELAGFAETAAELSALTETPPPPQLRGDVLAAIRTVRQDAPAPAAPRHADPASSPDPDAGAQGAPARTGDPRSRRRRRIAQFALAAAVAVAFAFGGWAAGRYQEAQLITAQSAAQEQLLRAPDSRIYHHPIPGGGSISYVVSQREDAAMVLLSGVHRPGDDRVYQLWTMHDQPGSKAPAIAPDRTFSGAGAGPIWVDGDVASAIALAISIEPEGGSPQPTTEPFAVQQL